MEQLPIKKCPGCGFDLSKAILLISQDDQPRCPVCGMELKSGKTRKESSEKVRQQSIPDFEAAKHCAFCLDPYADFEYLHTFRVKDGFRSFRLLLPLHTYCWKKVKARYLWEWLWIPVVILFTLGLFFLLLVALHDTNAQALNILTYLCLGDGVLIAILCTILGITQQGPNLDEPAARWLQHFGTKGLLQLVLNYTKDNKADPTYLLIAALLDENKLLRQAAAVALNKKGRSYAIKSLINDLKDEDPNIRQDAAVALGEIGDASAVEPLTALLKDEDTTVRRDAADALARINKSDIRPSGAAKKAQDADSRQVSIESKEWTTYTNKQAGFSLSHPMDWKRDFSGGKLVLYPKDFQGIPIRGNIIVRSPAITVVTGTVPADSPVIKMGRSIFYQQFLANQKQVFTNYRRLWEKRFTLPSGEESILWSYEFTKEEKPFHAISCLVSKEENTFVVDGSSFQPYAGKYEKILRKIVESLTLGLEDL